MSGPVIQADTLTKSYGDERAVDGVSFSVESGQVFGFIGQNGAGKSTTINIMLGFQKPSSGSIELFGEEINDNEREIRDRIGVVPENSGLYSNQTGYDHLRFASRIKDGDIDGIGSTVGLSEDELNREVGGYSTGMKKRLLLALALVGDPDLLVLDEPGSGLDPNGILNLQEIIQELSEEGTTVFFSSHILSNVETVCDKVGIIDDGSMKYTGPIGDLRREFNESKTLIVSFANETPKDSDLSALRSQVRELDVSGNREVQLKYSKHRSLDQIIDLLADLPQKIEDIDVEEKSLSELFGIVTEQGDPE